MHFVEVISINVYLTVPEQLNVYLPVILRLFLRLSFSWREYKQAERPKTHDVTSLTE